MVGPASFWDQVRSWADNAGLLLPQEDAEARPKVPESVCANCPICQGAATLDQVDAQALADLAELARGVVTGLGSALATAAEQRLTGESEPESSLAPRERSRPVRPDPTDGRDAGVRQQEPEPSPQPDAPTSSPAQDPPAAREEPTAD